jgi:hypothetical protein
MFNSDGTIKYAKRAKFLRWFMTGAIEKAVLKHRVRARVRFLIKEQRRYTDFILKYVYGVPVLDSRRRPKVDRRGRVIYKDIEYAKLTSDEQSRWYCVRRILQKWGIETHAGQTRADRIKRFKSLYRERGRFKLMVASCIYAGRSAAGYADYKAGIITDYKAYRNPDTRRMEFYFGLVNKRHWAYKEYMREVMKRSKTYIRRQFAVMGARKRRTQIAKMFLAVFVGKPGDKRVKDIKLQLAWLGYKTRLRSRKYRRYKKWMKWLNISLRRINRKLSSGKCRKYLRLLSRIQRKVRRIRNKRLRSAAFAKLLMAGLKRLKRYGVTNKTAARVTLLITKRAEILRKMGLICEAAAGRKTTLLVKVERRVRGRDYRRIQRRQLQMIRERQRRQRPRTYPGGGRPVPVRGAVVI